LRVKRRSNGRDSDVVGSCAELHSVIRIPAIVLLGIGAVVLVAAGVASNRQPRARGIGQPSRAPYGDHRPCGSGCRGD